MKHFDVVGIGRAYTDVVAPVSDEFLSAHNIPHDSGRAVSTEELLSIKSKLRNGKIMPGGLAANTLSGFAALGGSAGFFGKVARDREGMLSLADLRRRNIDMLCNPYATGAPMSATCLVLLTDDGNRSFAYNRGCADEFTAQDFLGFNFSNTKFLFIEGHMLTDSPATPLIDGMITRAQKQGCRVVVTLSDIPCWKNYAASARDIIASRADIIVANEREIAALAESAPVPGKPGQLIVTTNGEKGATASVDDKRFHVPAVTPSAFESSVGAGDQFIAGLLHGLSQNWGLEASLALAARTGSAILSEIGARPATDWRSLAA